MDANINWYEAERFDDWVRRYTPQLRLYVAAQKEKNLSDRQLRGISVISRLYERTSGAPVL